MDDISVKSRAKVNMTLLVMGKRPDGYHELRTLFAPISLCDEITITERADTQITVECDAAFVPDGKDNLAVKAARLFMGRFGKKAGLHIFIDKKIPVGGGMGGGSSNAAAVLKALRELLDVSVPGDELKQIASDLGSDVPSFIEESWCIGKGRGERLTPVNGKRGIPILLAKPEFGVSTPEVYAGMRPNEFSEDERALNDLLAALEGGIADWWPLAKNDLEQAALRVAPRLIELHDQFWGQGLRGMVSGTGSTIFCPLEDAVIGDTIAAELRNLGYWAMVTETE